jgi:hypothetical protein
LQYHGYTSKYLEILTNIIKIQGFSIKIYGNTRGIHASTLNHIKEFVDKLKSSRIPLRCNEVYYNILYYIKKYFCTIKIPLKLTATPLIYIENTFNYLRI